jgi:hypothetical protein
MEKRLVVLYGNSVIVGTVGASLRRSPQYKVVPMLPSQQSELEATAPDVVVFDLEATRPEAAFSMLESRPGLKLIGISPDNNLVRIWSGKQLRELSTQALLDVINEK